MNSQKRKIFIKYTQFTRGLHYFEKKSVTRPRMQKHKAQFRTTAALVLFRKNDDLTEQWFLVKHLILQKDRDAMKWKKNKTSKQLSCWAVWKGGVFGRILSTYEDNFRWVRLLLRITEGDQYHNFIYSLLCLE